MKVPSNVIRIISVLETAGFEAYIVGGCVRDSLLNRDPHDWDVCTNARPEQVKDVFRNERVLDTGLKHGTVTVLLGGDSYEVTTYRVDGVYTDNRRPDSVEFVSDLREDLARRDLTINAMAWNPRTGIVDPFGGAKDLSNRVISCVGDPDERFQEDSLRILRALRFAAVYGFSIECSTAASMHSNRNLLSSVSRERVTAELNKTLLGDNLVQLLSENSEILFEVIPELRPSFKFKQCNPWHTHDVYTHTLVAVESSVKDLVVRLTMLLHDIGKPSSFTIGEEGIGHFYGHPKVSADIAVDVLRRLKYDNDTTKAVVQLIECHDADIVNSVSSIRRWLNRIGEVRFRQLLDVRRADWIAQSEKAKDRLPLIAQCFETLDSIIAEGQCFSMRELAVNGSDLIAMGMTQGKEIGRVLSVLLQKVVDGELPNDRSVLLEYVSLI